MKLTTYISLFSRASYAQPHTERHEQLLIESEWVYGRIKSDARFAIAATEFTFSLAEVSTQQLLIGVRHLSIITRVWLHIKRRSSSSARYPARSKILNPANMFEVSDDTLPIPGVPDFRHPPT